MPGMRPNSGVGPSKEKAERDRQVKYLRWFRKRTAHLSSTFRPQFVRQSWMVEEQRWRGRYWWNNPKEKWWK